MVAPRRSGTRPVHRAIPIVAAAAVMMAGLGTAPAFADPIPAPVPVAPAPPAPVQPAPPTTAAEARTQLEQAQHDAEALTEQWHAATDDHDAKQAAADAAREAIGPAKEAADKAAADEETYRGQLDALTLATYRAGNLDEFNALLASRSPQGFLDQMSALETMAADHRTELDALMAKVAAARTAQSDADGAVSRAQQAADDARAAADEIQVRKAAAQARIDDVEKMISRLSPSERALLNGPDEGAPLGILAGTGIGARALAMAATKLGRPYVWGAAGPSSFDCSGLTSWAFKQVGLSLPRSSSAQARVGTPVSWDNLRPGDLVFYYNPVSHVGIYAGGGRFINAPQSGDVVKYQTVSRKAFSGARRL